MNSSHAPQPSFDHGAYCSFLEREIDRLAAIVEGADPATPVPTCPGWDLVALTKHVGVIQRWAAQMIRDGATERLDPRSVDRALPDGPAGYPAWARSTAGLLLAELRGHEPATAVWTWGNGHSVGWWARRMLFEAVVHGADAAIAVGVEPQIDAEVAVDGLDELLDNLPEAAAFAPAVADLRGDGETIHFHATDAPGEWMITLTPDGFRWEHGHGKGDVACRGPAADLLLLAYGRRNADDERFQRFGDVELLARWLRLSAI